jgi:hypothetical protein
LDGLLLQLDIRCFKATSTLSTGLLQRPPWYLLLQVMEVVAVVAPNAEEREAARIRDHSRPEQLLGAGISWLAFRCWVMTHEKLCSKNLAYGLRHADATVEVSVPEHIATLRRPVDLCPSESGESHLEAARVIPS